ncbi:TRAP transporter small permease [Rhodobacteraceae bacterium RKSG542]|uniref:TRAP transporter small permease n=1 Tax=Pseudovibrio flavus TaxID=2529854 RepID=UPI0012BCB9F9|nr:TRAP transporter small permease [Pseudovibrio flavus]MTI17747.1 TRAP transporter small permease [Pseudovibrio flavus]
MKDLAQHLPGRFGRFVQSMIRAKSAFIVASALIMAFTFFFVVIFRYIFKTDLFAYEEWLLPICFWMFFMGAAVGSYEDSHINADLFDNILSNPKALWIRKVIIVGLELIITCFLVYWALLMIGDEIAAYPNWKSTIALKIPFVVPRLGILLGFALMGFYSALHLYVLLKVGPRLTDPTVIDSK